MQKAIVRTSTDHWKRADERRPLYLRVAAEIERQIRTGTLRIGERVPSIRTVKREWQVSASTALQAYFWLENRGLIEARARSGFYVRVPYSDLVLTHKNQRRNMAALEGRGFSPAASWQGLDGPLGPEAMSLQGLSRLRKKPSSPVTPRSPSADGRRGISQCLEKKPERDSFPLADGLE